MATREITIWQVRMPGYHHHHAVDDVALGLMAGLERLGIRSAIVSRPDEITGRSIVLGSHLLPSLPEYPDQLPRDLVLFNLEQVTRRSPWITPAYVDLLRNHEAWDYSEQNLSAWREMGLDHVRLCGIGYEPELQRIPTGIGQDIDILFYGSLNHRRARILAALQDAKLRVRALSGAYGTARDRVIARAKIVLNMHYHEAQIFEMVRVSYLLANRRFVVSEAGADRTGIDLFAGGLAFAPYEQLVDTCLRYATDPEAREVIAQEGFRRMRTIRQSDLLERVVDQL
jgi:hypothetical protein